MERNDTALTGVKMMIADGIVTQEAAEKYFPELKESEDEKILRVLKKGFQFLKKGFQCYKNDEWYEGITNSQILAWLEKQGETFTKKDVDDAYVEGMALAKHELEKQGEQKPDDKVEPKFHKGDFVVDKDGRIFQIERIEKDFSHITYACSLIENPIFWFLYLEREIRKWTIQDAKDGDVLCWDDSKCIALFKNIYDEESFTSYGYVGGRTGTFHTIGSCHDTEGAHPATKEKRDILFEKMHEAGYEWDADKKELKELREE